MQVGKVTLASLLVKEAELGALAAALAGVAAYIVAPA